MVQFIDRGPSFGEQISQGVGGALQNFVNQLGQMALEKQKNSQRLKFLEQAKKNFNIGDMPHSENGELFSQGTENAELSSQRQDYFGLGEALTAAGEPELGRHFTERGKAESKQQFAREQSAEEKSSKYLDEVKKGETELNMQQTALTSARQAVLEGGDGGLTSGNFWASMFHMDALKNVSGAALDAAAKVHLLSSISNLSGGRPNMFLERQVGAAFALPGGSKEANLAKLDILQSLADMKRVEFNKANEIADRYESQGKVIPGKIGRMALKEATPEIQKIQKVTSYKLQDLLEPPAGSEELQSVKKVEKGTPLTQKKAAVLLKKANPKMQNLENPTEEEVERAFELAEGLGYDVTIFDLIG